MVRGKKWEVDLSLKAEARGFGRGGGGGGGDDEGWLYAETFESQAWVSEKIEGVTLVRRRLWKRELVHQRILSPRSRGAYAVAEREARARRVAAGDRWVTPPDEGAIDTRSNAARGGKWTKRWRRKQQADDLRVI